jgi:DNA (cytosine-5)-methyltransferase 1
MIKVFEMFSGYGGGSFALKKAEIEHEVIGFSEINKFAIKCYEQNHKGKNLGNCRDIKPEDLEDFNLLTAGFPCQSFSAAGKGLGELDTRGTLFYEIIRIAEVKKPKYMLLENVKGLTFKTHKTTFDKILSELDRIGYNVYWRVLKSSEYDIPQARERIYFVCIRKDIDTSLKFQFPEKTGLKYSITDLLELNPDKKYYLTPEQVERVLKRTRFGDTFIDLKTHCIQKHQKEEITYTETLPTLTCHDTENTFIINPYNGSFSEDEVVTIGTSVGTTTGKTSQLLLVEKKEQESKKRIIRKLTPKEAFRFMGFVNDEIKIENISDSQLYKLAGNGWDINLVSKIFKQMFKDTEYIK